MNAFLLKMLMAFLKHTKCRLRYRQLRHNPFAARKPLNALYATRQHIWGLTCQVSHPSLAQPKNAVIDTGPLKLPVGLIMSSCIDVHVLAARVNICLSSSSC